MKRYIVVLVILFVIVAWATNSRPEMPKSVRIGDTTYPIQMVAFPCDEKQADGSPSNYGCITYGKGHHIEVLKGLDLREERDTLEHEIQHGIVQEKVGHFPKYRLFSEDEMFEINSSLLLDVLRDNPEVRDYLL